MKYHLLNSIICLLFLMFSGASKATNVLGKETSIINTAKKNNDQLNPGIFIRKGVGYQGPKEEDVNKLPKFYVDSNVKNFTKRTNELIRKASKSKINGIKGGVVVIKKGVYLTKELMLKSNVHIRLEPEVVLRADQRDPSKAYKTKMVFNIGRFEAVENVSIIGYGNENERPIIEYKRESAERGKGGGRGFSIGAAKNLFIQNVLIKDDETKFSGVSFSFLKNTYTDKGRANNVTVDNVEQTNASYGYGLIQSNTGKNMLFSNLKCSGGVCARIETDNRFSKSKFGVSNIRVENVMSVRGKAAVYLNPHNLSNGDVYIDGAHSINSSMTIEIRPGFHDTTGKARYGKNSSIKNVTAVYGLESTVHFSGKKHIPKCLLSCFKTNGELIDKENPKIRQGPSICVIGDFVGQFKIDEETVSASIPDNEKNPDNSIENRKMIVRGKAYRGSNPEKRCGELAYD